MTRLPEVHGTLQLLVNILSMMIAAVAKAQPGLVICGRRRDEYIESKKFEMSVSV